ncbi:MAG TPA: hypothetical protein VJ697_04900 [Nitrososphaeraceae archaeon]|nr:hypothetical protein [Nitrososphaeraceae archaeon]
MTLPRGYKRPKEKEISDNKEFLDNSNDITNKKENSLTNEILQSISIDDTINEVIEKGKDVVVNIEETVKKVVKKGKDVIVGDSSNMDKSLRYENQYNSSQLTQEKNNNNNKNYNHSDNSNLGINTDKSSSGSTKEELTTTTIPTPISTKQQKEETKRMLDNKEKEQYGSSFIITNTVPLEEVKVKEKSNKFLDNQTQQIKNKTFTISETTNKINDNINQNQDTHKAYLEKNISTANNFQQEATNTSQSIFNNYIELQKNVVNTFQSTFSKFLNNTSKSYWNYFQYPQRDIDTYRNSIQTIWDNAINYKQRVHDDAALIYAENFTKSIEIAQRYYNNSVQNYFDFLRKIERCTLKASGQSTISKHTNDIKQIDN